jgi:hypothetical protein
MCLAATSFSPSLSGSFLLIVLPPIARCMYVLYVRQLHVWLGFLMLAALLPNLLVFIAYCMAALLAVAACLHLLLVVATCIALLVACIASYCCIACRYAVACCCRLAIGCC